MYQDYIITAIFLLVIALVIGGLTIRRYNIPYLYFLGATVLNATFLTDVQIVGDAVVKVMYPWFIPLFFLVGPGLYGSYCSINERRNRWHIIHYLPVIIGYVILIVQLAFFNNRFYETVQLAHELRWDTTGIFWPFSDKWILLAYPFHVLLYVFTSISKLNANKAKLPLYILPLAQGVFLIPLLDINYYFLTGENLIFTNDEVLRYIMFGLVFLIFWDVVNIRPRMQKAKEAEIKAFEAEKEAERQAALIQEAPKEIYPNAGKITNRDFVLYIDELIQGNEELPFNKHSKKANFIKKSPFKSTEWDNFFFDTSTNFGFFKKYIRIQRAIGLMEEDYLENDSVESLAKTVGYSSRAPFYIAFEQIMGKSLTDYREDGKE
jgi:methylphosphotriester-DNA--protein-cysteine methyltransferase